jgi:hypothetical protein
MRLPHQSAVIRRDAHLNRTRRLSLWIAGSATAASLGLTVALGHALPGHTVSSGSQSAPGTTTSGSHNGTGSGSGSGSGTSGSGNVAGGNGGSGRAGTARHHHHALARPRQAPTPASTPVVSSGGS